MTSETNTTPVLIAGGGPVGLMLALELDHRGIDAILIEQNPTTTRHPKMDITNGRSMEMFRRLGVIDDLRAAAVPEHHPMSVIWTDAFSGPEIARFDYPPVAEARKALRASNDGSMAAEPSMRISQIHLEPVLKSHLDRHCRHIDVRFGWALDTFVQDDDGVTVTIRNTETGATEQVRAQYLAGCDGAGSVARRTLGIALHTIEPADFAASGRDRTNYLDGERGQPEPPRQREPKVLMIHFTTLDPDIFERIGAAWHYQSPLGWSLISQNDKDTWTIHQSILAVPDYAERDPKDVLFEIVGREFECEILQYNPWRPHLALADHYGSGRVWLAGDSVHQVIPTGGYGMNSGLGDALGLAWALAANVQGWGGPGLFEAYERERRHVGARVRLGSARHSLIRRDIAKAYDPVIGQDDDEGRARREEYGKLIIELGNLENEAWGLEWGYRYDGSSVIIHEDGEAPPYDWETVEPSTWPGVRAPNVFLGSGEPIHDLFGTGFTLVNFGGE
ncbi:MAG: FAD-dependent monooxygenase, partial [Ilumatobacter sp.]